MYHESGCWGQAELLCIYVCMYIYMYKRGDFAFLDYFDSDLGYCRIVNLASSLWPAMVRTQPAGLCILHFAACGRCDV